MQLCVLCMLTSKEQLRRKQGRTSVAESVGSSGLRDLNRLFTPSCESDVPNQVSQPVG